MSNSNPITELDFFAVKNQLKEYLKGQSQFLDYDFEGSNMSVLLDILAYNTFQNNYYTNMAMSEMFLDSAQLRNSIISHAKELNYLPRSIRASRARVQVDFTNVAQVSETLPSYLTIPAYTKFVGRKSGQTFSFTNDHSVTVTPDSNNLYCFTGLDIYQGKILTEEFTVTNNDSQRFTLSNENIDTDSIKVSVRENVDSNSNATEYLYKDGIFGVKTSDKVFYIQPGLDSKYEVAFGSDVFGYEPKAGEVVVVTYRTTRGEEANGILTFTADAIDIGGNAYSVTVTTMAQSEGGAPQESNNSIRRFAPKAIQVQDRAITESDYEVLLKTNFPEIQAVSVYGGESLSPPRYGKVVVSVDTQNAQGVSDNLSQIYARFLRDRSPISIEPIVVSAQFMNIQVNCTLYYNTKTTDTPASSIKGLIIDAIQNYSDNSLNEFGKTLRFSKLLNAIDSADNNIMSNDTTIRAIIDFTPEIATSTSYAINFKNKLQKDQLSEQLSQISDYEPAIKTSLFTLNTDSGFIQDNGRGVLQFVTATNAGTFTVINRNVGTVNYDTGEVRIDNIVVNDFVGSAIKVYAHTTSSDIASPKERILAIRPADLTVNVIGTRD